MINEDKLKAKTPKKITTKIKQEQNSKRVSIQFLKANTGSSKRTRVSGNIDRKPPLNNGRKGTSNRNNTHRPYRHATKGMLHSSMFIILVQFLVLIFISF